jgi:hypothetical protein
MRVLNQHHLKRGRWPAGAVYVGRGHPLGNPFRIGSDGDREAVIARYRARLVARLDAGDRVILAAMRALTEDSDLVCSCAPKPCHADVILEVWRERIAPTPPAVFVFGSNTAGRHGAGAARYAAAAFGAERGVGDGPTGRAYGIPTKDARLKTLRIPEILPAVRRFLYYAAKHPDTEFVVTPIGTGLAGYPKDWIAPLFAAPGSNVAFIDTGFEALVPKPTIARRVIVAGSRSITDRTMVFDALDRLAAKWSGAQRFEVVCGEARGADTLGREWAQARGYPVRPMPARWAVLDVPGAIVQKRGGRRYNARAGHDRNAWMAAYGTHLVAFWDGRSRGTRSMIDLAKVCGVPVWVPDSRPLS